MSNQELVKLQTLLTKLYTRVESTEDKKALLNAYDIINSIIKEELSKGGI